MNAGLFQSATLSVAETFANGVLALDASAAGKLEKLSGKILQVHCEFPPLTVNLLVCEDGILLSGAKDISADATVRGKAHDLLKLLVTSDTGKLREDGVVITGDTAFLAALQQVFRELDVDWEYQLSKLIGDIPTQIFSDTVAGTRKFARQSSENLRADIDAWLHEEIKLFPDSTELENFYCALDKLRLRVDRLAARTAKLQSSR